MSTQELTELTRQHYEHLIRDLGAHYVHHRWGDHPIKRSHYRHTSYAVAAAFAEIGPVESLLEIGCGPGVWTDMCVRHAGSVSLLDISSEMLKVAREKYRNTPRVAQYYCGDYIQMAPGLPPGYGAIFSARALEYMSDKVAMVRQSFRLLAPGGQLCVITKNPAWRDNVRTAPAARDEIQRDWIHWKALARIFGEAGFTRVFVRPVAIGSYERPFSSSPGIALSDLAHRVIRDRPMREAYDPLTESYLILGTKPVAAG